MSMHVMACGSRAGPTSPSSQCVDGLYGMSCFDSILRRLNIRARALATCNQLRWSLHNLLKVVVNKVQIASSRHSS